MNPLFQKIAGSLVRGALMAAISYLVAKGIIEEGAISAAQVDTVVAAVLAVVWGWLVWRKNKRELQIQQTALATKNPMATLDDVKEAVKAGVTAPANTPGNAIPQINVPATQEADRAKDLVL